MIIDTHCHLDFPDFKDDIDDVIKRAVSLGVKYFINVASSMEGCISSEQLSQKYDNVFYTLGIHPHYAKDVTDFEIKKIEEMFLKDKKAIAIGEVGLDFYRNLSPKDKQIEVFLKFIELKKKLGLPIIVHTRDSLEETFDILTKEIVAPVDALIHCFSGDIDFMRKVLDAGMYISFTCNVTYKKAQMLREVLKYVPLDRVMIETDAPYLSPEQLRGKRNEPANLVCLLEFLSQLLNKDKKEIELQTTKNAVDFFNLELEPSPFKC